MLNKHEFLAFIFDGVGAGEYIAVGKHNFAQPYRGPGTSVPGPHFMTATYDGEMSEPGKYGGRFMLTKNTSVVNIYAVGLDDLGTKVMEGAGVRELVAAFDPDWIMETSPGNYQAGYRIVVTSDRGAVKALVAALCDAGLSDAGARGSHRKFKLIGGKHRTKDWVTALVYINGLRPRWELSAIAALHRVVPGPVARELIPRDWRGGDDPYVGVLMRLGLVVERRGDWFDIVCPWADKHTDPAEDLAGYKIGGVFNCFHEHGAAHGTREFKTWLHQAHGVDTLAFDQEMNAAQIAADQAEMLDRLRAMT